MRNRIAICSTLLSVLVGLVLMGLSSSAFARSGEPLATTTFEFNPSIFESLGLRITGVTQTGEPEAPGQLAFVAVPPSALVIEAPLGDFEGFESGVLHHSGGFTLELPDGAAISLQGFRLEFESYPFMDMADAAGNRWFTLSSCRRPPSTSRRATIGSTTSIS